MQDTKRPAFPAPCLNAFVLLQEEPEKSAAALYFLQKPAVLLPLMGCVDSYLSPIIFLLLFYVLKVTPVTSKSNYQYAIFSCSSYAFLTSIIGNE